MKPKYFVVEESALPETFLKVMDAKELLRKGHAKTVQEASKKAGISRSAYYKYKDAIAPLYENTLGKNVTFSFDLEDARGVLSHLLNQLADAGANILTINQTIPINGVANVMVTIETKQMHCKLETLIKRLERLRGVQSLRMLARE